MTSEGVTGLVEAIRDVAACSAVSRDSATEVGESFGCWTIFSVHFDRPEDFGSFNIITSVLSNAAIHQIFSQTCGLNEPRDQVFTS